ncbi:hypothetical protein D9M70_627260 [compost metagenome]
MIPPQIGVGASSVLAVMFWITKSQSTVITTRILWNGVSASTTRYNARQSCGFTSVMWPSMSISPSLRR